MQFLGLLSTPVRAGGGVRRYGEQDLRRLRFIRQAKAAGFTLEQIAELLALDATEDRARARALTRQRIIALDAKITELTRAGDALVRLSKKCAAASRGPCPIIAAFDHC